MVTRATTKWTAFAALVALSALFLMPFVWMVSTSLKHEARIFSGRWMPETDVRDAEDRPIVRYRGADAALLGVAEDGRYRVLVGNTEALAFQDEVEMRLRPGFHWRNYTRAFEMMRFTRNLRNTLFVCFTTVLGTVLSSSLAAYGLSRIPWRGREFVFWLVLATMMVPYQVTLIPLFAVYAKLGWIGTFKPLILPYFFGVPFYIFLLRQFFKGIPEDLSAAARIDGCTEFGIYARIILPLAKPALATTALFMFLWQWGDFLSPLVYLQDDRQYTLAVALQQFQSQHESAWGPLMAMSTVITLPVIALFFFTQRTFIQGITLTGLKG
ncbi:MAG TPA: carbohydrate ABC transporter permease [Candidatus Hydrogenedentes bacterium]|nr:carbohydrate ABC transporter permease [Candidatus Hydrogenedentota bacterium]HNT87263.1 carbohydrate ABC transporter permease [Candidatus Hydrogenedentota bacterium]